MKWLTKKKAQRRTRARNQPQLRLQGFNQHHQLRQIRARVTHGLRAVACAKLTDSYLEPVESSRYACCASASARSSCARGIPANTPVVVFKFSVLSRVQPTSAPVIFWGVQPPRPAPPVSVPSAVTLPARVQSHPRVCLTSSPDAAGRTAPHTHTRGSPALHSRARAAAPTP